jgi:hypothetical protein
MQKLNERCGPMTSFPRLILQCGATTGIAAMLSIAAPVTAAEMAVRTAEPAARIAPSKIKHHASRVRLAAVHHRPRVNPILSDLGCTGVWCGRQFVLMIGVGF